MIDNVETSEQLTARNIAAGQASLAIGLFLLLGTTAILFFLGAASLLNGVFNLIYLAAIFILAFIGLTLGKKSRTTIGKVGIVLVILGTIVNLLYSYAIYGLSNLTW